MNGSGNVAFGETKSSTEKTMKTFKRKKGQPEHKVEALRFALNEHLNDLRMIAELKLETAVEGLNEQRTFSGDELMDELRKSYVGRFRTKRLRKKHADLVLPRAKGVSWP